MLEAYLSNLTGVYFYIILSLLVANFESVSTLSLYIDFMQFFEMTVCFYSGNFKYKVAVDIFFISFFCESDFCVYCKDPIMY